MLQGTVFGPLRIDFLQYVDDTAVISRSMKLNKALKCAKKKIKELADFFNS